MSLVARKTILNYVASEWFIHLFSAFICIDPMLVWKLSKTALIRLCWCTGRYGLCDLTFSQVGFLVMQTKHKPRFGDLVSYKSGRSQIYTACRFWIIWIPILQPTCQLRFSLSHLPKVKQSARHIQCMFTGGFKTMCVADDFFYHHSSVDSQHDFCDHQIIYYMYWHFAFISIKDGFNKRWW